MATLAPPLRFAAARLFDGDMAANGVVFDRAMAPAADGDVFASERYAAVIRDDRAADGFRVVGFFAREGDAARAMADAADAAIKCVECGHPESNHDCCPLRCEGCGAGFTYHSFTLKGAPK